jgi:hypothetical protein
MDLDAYALALGKLVGNLMSLETLLRSAIHAATGAAPTRALDTFNVGDQVPADALTNYNALGQNIDAYNAFAPIPDWIDKQAIVDVRDAIAHGRVMTTDPTVPLTLAKFSRPDGAGMVTVTTKLTLDAAWFSSQMTLVRDAIEKARKHVK